MEAPSVEAAHPATGGCHAAWVSSTQGGGPLKQLALVPHSSGPQIFFDFTQVWLDGNSQHLQPLQIRWQAMGLPSTPCARSGLSIRALLCAIPARFHTLGLALMDVKPCCNAKPMCPPVTVVHFVVKTLSGVDGPQGTSSRYAKILSFGCNRPCAVSNAAC